MIDLHVHSSASDGTLSPEEVARAGRDFALMALTDHDSTEGEDAFGKVLGDGCPADIPHSHVKPEVAVERIHAAGGIAILAHPFSWTKDTQALRRGLVRLKDIGVDGIEAHYQAYSPQQRQILLELAHEMDFLVTAGSDYHGGNKPNIQLGMEVPDESAFIDAITARLPQPRD